MNIGYHQANFRDFKVYFCMVYGIHETSYIYWITSLLNRQALLFILQEFYMHRLRTTTKQENSSE